MKNYKKFLAPIMASAVILSSMSLTAMNAFADDTTYTITISHPYGENISHQHKFEAYQIFAGDLSKNKLTNIVWGSGIQYDDKADPTKSDDNSGKLVDALKADTLIGSYFTDAETAADVAKVLQDTKDKKGDLIFANDSKNMFRFSKIVGKFLTNHVAGTTEMTTTNPPSASDPVTIGGLAPGYYFVKDDPSVLAADTNTRGAETAYILCVVGNVSVDAKTDVPTIQKHIVEDNKEKVGNTASIGDTVNYRIESVVPNVLGFEKYFYVIKDRMSDGLTFNDGSLKVYKRIGTAERVQLTAGTDYILSDIYVDDPDTTSVKETVGTGFKVKMLNAVNLVDLENKVSIIVEYSATLNEKADITTAGNTNEAVLHYSNNPNFDYQGTDEPDDWDDTDDSTDDNTDNDNMGKTPEAKVTTYTTALRLQKTNGDGSEILPGAKFTISGDALNVAIINKKIFKEDSAGTYYMLKNGTYTEDAPTPETTKNYDSVEKKYSLVTVIDKTTDSSKISKTAYVDEDGYLVFRGLNAGKYTIHEDEAPLGYNRLEKDIEVVIEAPLSLGNGNITWNVKYRLSPTSTYTTIPAYTPSTDTDGLPSFVTIDVKNEAGAQLPSTGGIGTTLFYIVGSMMMAGAAVLFVMKRKAEKN